MAPKVDEGYCVYGAGVLARQLQALQGEIPGVREASDIEAVHRMRVASRRLRAALPLFSDCLPRKKYADWMKAVRAITGDLGAARDTDVQIVSLRQVYQALPSPAEKPGVRRLILRLRQRRARLQKKVQRDLDRLEAAGTLAAMAAALEPRLARQGQVYLYTPYIYERAFTAISTCLEDFLAYEPYVERPECVAELHAMRIAAKKLRYTLEAFAPIYAGEMKEHLAIIRRIQDALGSIHDSDVWILTLPQFLEKEARRTLDYFGHTRPMKRLAPGIQYFAGIQQASREREYAGFVVTWRGLLERNTWDALAEIIRAPYHTYAEALAPGAETPQPEPQSEPPPDEEDGE